MKELLEIVNRYRLQGKAIKELLEVVHRHR